MPKFYFDVHDGRDRPDHAGIELIDLDEARREAMSLAGMILLMDPAETWKGEIWSIDVRDQDRQHLFTVSFSARPKL